MERARKTFLTTETGNCRISSGALPVPHVAFASSAYLEFFFKRAYLSSRFERAAGFFILQCKVKYQSRYPQFFAGKFSIDLARH